MVVPVQNYTIEQGDDATISLVYQTGPLGAEVAPNLTSGYSVRMDIRTASVSGDRVWTFNSADIPGEPEADTTGVADNEATLGTAGQINITVPRALSLAGGAIFDKIVANNLVFAYDLFIRTPDGKQRKLLQGTLTYNKSVTLWA